MPSAEEIRARLVEDEAEWRQARAEIIEEFPSEATAIALVDWLYGRVWYFLDRAERAEHKGRRELAIFHWSLCAGSRKVISRRVEEIVARCGIGVEVPGDAR